jgi:ribosomal protein S18 acetylase RimI-like enzyme
MRCAPRRRGHGHAILNWFETEARGGGARNAWICAVSINSGALKLYASCGYEQVAILDDLIKSGLDEILMRKKLNPSDN